MLILFIASRITCINMPYPNAVLKHDTIRHAYPINNCINFNHNALEDFQLLLHDAAFVHCTLLTAAVVEDFIHERPPAYATRLHLTRTLALLNERLATEEAQIDSTLHIIISLGTISDLFGERAATNAHMTGLGQILQMRGGITFLRRNPKLHFKIGRLDLAWSLSTGDMPRLLPNPVCWDPLYKSPSCIAASSYTNSDASDDNDIQFQLFTTGFSHQRLATVFNDLRQLTFLINKYTNKNIRLDGSQFLDALCSIQTRLLYLKDTISDGSSNDNIAAECLRLGMLAYLSTTFRAPGRKTQPAYLTTQLRAICQRIEPSMLEIRDVLFWLLMVGTISVFDVHEPWLRNKLDGILERRLSWGEARGRLLSVMWIIAIHDDLGKEAYSELMRST